MKALTSILIFATLAASAFALYSHSSAARVGEALEEAQGEARQLQNELTAAGIRAGKEGAPSLDGTPEEVLRSRIAQLEAQLSEKEAAVTELSQQVAAAPEAAAPEATPAEEELTEEERRERNREEWQQRRQERMAQIREEDPEEYKRIQQERQDFQRRVTDHVGGQVEFFAVLNTEGLPQEYVDNHLALVEKLSAFQERAGQMITDPAAEGGGLSGRELWGSMHELAPMLEMERQVVLNDFAMELGYPPDEAKSFVEYVDYVNEMTSPRAIMHSLGGGRGGRR